MTASFVVGAMVASLFEWKVSWLNVSKKPQKMQLFAVNEHKPFVIIVPSFNNSEWVEKNLSSIFGQKYDQYRVIYIDDASNDNTLALVKAYIDSRQYGHRIDVIHNDVNKGACENIYNAVRLCGDDEIAVILDGDDWFAHERVLARLNEIYANPNVWLTYGSYIEYPSYSYTVANFAHPLPKKVIEKNTIRTYIRKHWCLSHLRTFYSSLYKKIKREDLFFEGKFYDAAQDLGFMIPLVEMAGNHAQFVNEVLLIYNRANALNDHKLRAKRQQLVAQHILDLPPYARLQDLGLNAL
jgi:glycosyltransferase involved in cell wall biosynthesis